MRRAMAISESVPQPPPIAITALAARTISALRISPIPVASATSMSGFASRGSFPGRMPTVSPPACFAPRAAAAITPPSPPHSRTAPRSAIRRPTAGAHDHEVHLRLAHQRARDGVGNDGARDPGMPELPGREPGALEHRPRFVDEDVQASPGFVGEIEGRERGSDPAGRERTRVAVGEHLGAETRPVLQGARLTAWELGHAGVPCTV